MADLQNLVEELSKLTVLEAAELSKLLEEKWGVSAAAPVAAAAAPAAAAAAAPVEEQTEFTVILAKAGDKKINVIKEVRTITGLGLKEAKDLVEAAPKPVKEGVEQGRSREDQEDAGRRRCERGGEVTLPFGTHRLRPGVSAETPRPLDQGRVEISRFPPAFLFRRTNLPVLPVWPAVRKVRLTVRWVIDERDHTVLYWA